MHTVDLYQKQTDLGVKILIFEKKVRYHENQEGSSSIRKKEYTCIEAKL